MDLGQLVMGNGIPGSLSYNGFKVDLLKSAMQKYTRRCNFEKLVYCMIELDLFSRLGECTKLIRSNMRNRIMIILCEDISIANWRIIPKVNDCIQKWESTRHALNSLESIKELIKICKYFDQCERIRYCDYLKCIYRDGSRRKSIVEKYPELYKFKKVKVSPEYKPFYLEKDSETAKRYICNFVYLINNQSDKAFYWFYKILNLKSGECARRSRKSKTEFVIWDVLHKIIQERKNSNLEKLYDVLYSWFLKYNNTRNENMYYLVCMICFVIHEKEYDWDSEIEDVQVSDSEAQKYLDVNLSSKMEMDSYVYDMHCSDGRNRGSGKKDFVEEGRKVVNMSKKFQNDLYDKVFRILNK